MCFSYRVCWPAIAFFSCILHSARLFGTLEILATQKNRENSETGHSYITNEELMAMIGDERAWTHRRNGLDIMSIKSSFNHTTFDANADDFTRALTSNKKF